MYNKLQTTNAPTSTTISQNLLAVYTKICSRRLYLNLAIAAAYLGITLVVTWPILPNFDKQITETGDPLFIAWVVGSETWSLKTGDLANFWNQTIFYPYKNTLALSDHSLTLTLQALPTYLLTNNPIVTINTLLLLSFFLSAFFAYFLIYYYTDSRRASFVGGAVFGFCTYHVTQLEHLQVTGYQYIPLTILFFEKLLKSPNWKNTLLFSLFFTLNAFVSIYLLGFTLVPLAIIIFARLLSRVLVLNKNFIFNFAGALILSGVLVVPWLLPYLQVARDFNVVRLPTDYYGRSARLGDFLVANQNNWLMRDYSAQVKATEPEAFWNERTLYAGIFTIGLALSGVLSRDMIKKRFFMTTNSSIWLAVLVVGAAISFGPILAVNEAGQPTLTGPYLILTQLVPIYNGIRVPTRVMVVVVLALAVLIGFTAQKVEAFKPRGRCLGYAAILIILLIEQGSFPLKLSIPVPINTALYEWSAVQLPKEAVLVHYPFNNFDAVLGYLRGSLIDHKRTLNGYSSFTPESIQKLEFLSVIDPASFVKICATLGIGYLVVHKDFIKSDDSLALYLKDQKLSSLVTIGNDDVYDISSYKDTRLYNTSTTYATGLENGKLELSQKNNSATIWVAPEVERFNIHVNYLKEGNKVGENKLTLYKPLYLLPGETYSTTLEISPPLFTGYDSIKAEVK